MHLRDVAFNVVHEYPGGAPSLAPRMGRNPTTLAHELNGTGVAKLGLLDAEKITHITGDLRILEAFARNAGQMLLPLPEALMPEDEEDCMMRLAEAAKAFGVLCKEVATDLADTKITDNELKRIDRDCSILIADLRGLRKALAKLNAASKVGLG